MENKYVSSNLDGLRMFKRMVGYAKKLEVDVGFVSRGKKNRKKVYHNVIAPAEGKSTRPKRNPVALAIKDKPAMERIQKELEKGIWSAIEEGVAEANKGQAGYRFAKPLKSAFKQAGDQVAELIKEKFDELPAKKFPAKSRSVTPLQDTGALRRSVKARFWRARRK